MQTKYRITPFGLEHNGRLIVDKEGKVGINKTKKMFKYIRQLEENETMILRKNKTGEVFEVIL